MTRTGDQVDEVNEDDQLMSCCLSVCVCMMGLTTTMLLLQSHPIAHSLTSL
jgi:hypothetical protein